MTLFPHLIFFSCFRFSARQRAVTKRQARHGSTCKRGTRGRDGIELKAKAWQRGERGGEQGVAGLERAELAS